MFTFMCCKQLLNWILGFTHLEKFCILILGLNAKTLLRGMVMNYPEQAQFSCLIRSTENK